MLKKQISVLLFFSFLIFLDVSAQINTYSPYSRYGFGEMERQGIGFTRAMGGVGIGMRMENQINYLNPASYTTQDSSSFIFDFGLSGSMTNYKSSTNSFSIKNASFSHLAISFPVTRWMFVSGGVVPFSKVGYNVIQEGVNQPYIGTVDSYYEGSGGLNRMFLGTGIKWKNLSFGLNAYYLTGSLSYDKSYIFPFSDKYFSTKITDKYSVRNVYIGVGAQYVIKLNNNSSLILGAIFDNKSALKGTHSNFIRNTYSGASQSAVDTVNFEENSETGIVLPNKLGLGASINLNRKLILAIDYTTQDWSEFKMPDNTGVMKKSSVVNIGLQFTPNDQALRGYLNHVNFRLGGYYSNTNLKLINQDIKDYGATIGLGLPFSHSRSMFHIGYQVGQRGTLSNGLIKENYQNIYLSLTLYDIWFIKSKFD